MMFGVHNIILHPRIMPNWLRVVSPESSRKVCSLSPQDHDHQVLCNFLCMSACTGSEKAIGEGKQDRNSIEGMFV